MAPLSRSIIDRTLESFASTLRMYALKVTASVELDEPHTAELAKKLLGPLLHWHGSTRAAPDSTRLF